MSNRRQRSRRRTKILGTSNELFFKLLAILIAIILVLILALVINNVKAKKEAKVEAKKSDEEVQKLYEDMNDHIASTDDYKTNTVIRMTAVGNVLYNKNLESSTTDFSSVFENIKNDFKDSDFSIGTYSANISEDKDRNLAKSIKETGVSYMSIANNKQPKIKDISKLESSLKEAEIETTGKYSNEAENRVKIIEKRNIKIAVIAYSEEANSNEANEENKSNVYSEEQATNDLAYATENASIVIVMMNWKKTPSTNVTDNEKNIANFLVQNGANAVIGTNEAGTQQMEMIENKDGKKCLVAYSLGNFIPEAVVKTKSNSQTILDIQFFVDVYNNVSVYKVEYTNADLEYTKDTGYKIISQTE